jgi:membrane associated rhomboid family serine protease
MPQNQKSGFGQAVTQSAVVVGILFVVKAVEILCRLSFERYGIIPREKAGLAGIVFSPFLHADMQHLMANALPLLVLLTLLLANSTYHPHRTLILIWVASGLGTWLIGRGGTVHIGASSIVFGLAAFLIVAGFYAKSWRAVAVAIFVFLFYGGIFAGALPRPGPISWEGHLCGAVAGVWGASRLKE